MLSPESLFNCLKTSSLMDIYIAYHWSTASEIESDLLEVTIETSTESSVGHLFWTLFFFEGCPNPPNYTVVRRYFLYTKSVNTVS